MSLESSASECLVQQAFRDRNQLCLFDCCNSCCRVIAVSATRASAATVNESRHSGLCASLLSSVLVEPFDPRRLLGMVNVASTLSLGFPQLPPPGERSHLAFVVGVGDYFSFDKLHCSSNDAADVGNLLGVKGFSVFTVPNPTRSQFVEAFEQFCEGLDGARSVVIFFAGHGVAPSSESFLLAVDSTAGMPCGH